ncbi:MAG: exonuclease SbcCD subunit D C-terminal domain-containing protein [Chitinophagaceae bacterium]|nr:exonuclease SbcCD subunit D C-terminal domain-containing protein [Chitinophagaceae bacterium]MCW5929332.1 exonuclease SbcCD subunit D C-terminal domain-containing protein [Chitinophagaceae bacterium]
MKILHTADWHIGQLFYAYDRTYEHQQFLNWLTDAVVHEKADVLLISGDVFDIANPSAASIKMFYSFLNRVVKASPGLQIVVTAGNHDSAARLEAPKPLLESSNIHIVGVIERTADGAIDYEKMIIPLHNRQGETEVLCLAVPFLRMGDYPVIPDAANSYTEGVAALYRELASYAKKKLKNGQSLVAMGHLHVQNADITEMDTSERPIMGGVEGIKANTFAPELLYVALGHIHKAQALDAKGIIRYSGSPLPMSFSERGYVHEIVSFEIEDGSLRNLTGIPVPVRVPLQRIPEKPALLPEVLGLLQQLPSCTGDLTTAPYLEVRVLLDGPEPALRHKIEEALKDKQVRLARIESARPYKKGDEKENQPVTRDALTELKPGDLFSKLYFSKYNTEAPDNLLQLFNQVMQEAAAKER